MANCNSCNSSCQTGNRVGALNSLCRTGCRYPYYTGPCPAAPCNNGCGCGSNSSCNRCCGCNATITDPNNGCGCTGCNGCNGCSGCNSCSSCGTCDSCVHRPCDCNPCENMGGLTECAEDWLCHGYHAAHGVFTANGPLNLSPGSAVNFENRGGDPHCFGNSYGSILIRHPGLYFAAITVDIPKNADADTVMRLELDGRAITPPEIAVCTGCSGGPCNFCGHAIFRACAGSLLKLVTLRELSIECTTAQPVFTVTLFRIC